MATCVKTFPKIKIFKQIIGLVLTAALLSLTAAPRVFAAEDIDPYRLSVGHDPVFQGENQAVTIRNTLGGEVDLPNDRTHAYFLYVFHTFFQDGVQNERVHLEEIYDGNPRLAFAPTGTAVKFTFNVDPRDYPAGHYTVHLRGEDDRTVIGRTFFDVEAPASPVDVQLDHELVQPGDQLMVTLFDADSKPTILPVEIEGWTLNVFKPQGNFDVSIDDLRDNYLAPQSYVFVAPPDAGDYTVELFAPSGMSADRVEFTVTTSDVVRVSVQKLIFEGEDFEVLLRDLDGNTLSIPDIDADRNGVLSAAEREAARNANKDVWSLEFLNTSSNASSGILYLFKGASYLADLGNDDYRITVPVGRNSLNIGEGAYRASLKKNSDNVVGSAFFRVLPSPVPYRVGLDKTKVFPNELITVSVTDAWSKPINVPEGWDIKVRLVTSTGVTALLNIGKGVSYAGVTGRYTFKASLAPSGETDHYDVALFQGSTLEDRMDFTVIPVPQDSPPPVPDPNIDVFVILDEDGGVLTDANGDVLKVAINDQGAVVGNPLFKAKLDAAGEPVTDIMGNPVIQNIAGKEFNTRIEVAVTQRCAGFSDISIHSKYCSSIRWAQNIGVIAGYPDGTFRPRRLMNRVELLKVVLEAREVPLPPYDGKSTFGFRDVLVDQWYMPYIQQGKALRIFEGDSGGKRTARPSEPVNRVESLKLAFATMVAVDAYFMTSCPVQQYIDAPSARWFYDYACKAKEFGLFDLADSARLLPGKKATRAEVVLMLYRMNNAGLFFDQVD